MKDNIKVWIDEQNPSIQRIQERCVNCGLCLNVCQREVGLDRKFEKDDVPLCINCGQCVLNCPMGALTEKFDYKKVLNLIKDTDKLVSISIAPAVRVALGEELGFELGQSMENVLPTILREMGFSYVFDVTFGADVTIMEEASELVNRITTGGVLPMYTSCCPAWTKYVSMFHPELIPSLSTTKSPISIQSSLIKSYFKEMNSIEDEIISVAVAPCTAKKYEATYNDTDYVITTRELALMIKECSIDIPSLKPSSFDSTLGKGSKSGLIFGRSGGVMEAALSTAHYLLTGKNPEKGTYHLDITSPITEKSYKIADKIINIAVVYGLPNLESILPDANKYDFIEVMNCPGGCVGGGGQPLCSKGEASLRKDKRTDGLNQDENIVEYSHENKEVEELYSSYLVRPLSEKAESLLHAEHKDLSNLIKKQ